MLTKTLKTRLQKLIDAIADQDHIEMWHEFSTRMNAKEKTIALRFNVGDEVAWEDTSGTIIEILDRKCRVREDTPGGITWLVSASLLRPVDTLKTK